MKLKLMKCQICAHWFSPYRSHCPACSATKVELVSIHKIVYVNHAHESRPGILMGSAYTNLTWSSSLTDIAKQLAR